MKNKTFTASLRCAVLGFINAVLEERNLRFDIAAATIAAVFGYAYGLDATGWAVLAIVCVSVISGELFNTALEDAVNTATLEYNEFAKKAKDVSAAAVLVRAVGAVAAGLFLFSDPDRFFTAVLNLYFSRPAFYITIVLIIIDILFVLFFKKKK